MKNPPKMSEINFLNDKHFMVYGISQRKMIYLNTGIYDKLVNSAGLVGKALEQ